MKRHILKDKDLTSLRNYRKDLILRLIVKRFQKLRHVQPTLDILFGKLTIQIGD